MDAKTVGGTVVPSVGLGTWRLSGKACRRSVLTALELGYRHVDTAQAYGNERQVGEAIRDSDVDREEVFVTTKLARGNLDRRGVHRSVEESLIKLDTEYLDLLLIHWPDPRVPLRETLGAMNELVDAGTVRNIGVSNFNLDRLHRARELSDHDLLTNQVQYNPYWSQTELLDYCRIHDVLLTAHSPLAHGGVLDDPVLEEIGSRYEKTAAQVALRWLVQQPNVVAVPKATIREHLIENVDVFDFELTDEEMEQVRRPSKRKALSGFLQDRLRSVGCRTVE